MTPRTAFKLIRLELAREPGHPEGDPGHAYRMLLPLNENGQIDPVAWKADPARCRVARIDPEGEQIGQLVHGPGGRWSVDYPTGQGHSDVGFRFEDERFIPGEYVTIKRDDGEHTYRVVSQQSL